MCVPGFVLVCPDVLVSPQKDPPTFVCQEAQAVLLSDSNLETIITAVAQNLGKKMIFTLIDEILSVGR